MTSYTSLHTYWTCPRLYAFRYILNYTAPLINSAPVITGQLAHTGISAFYCGKNYKEAINADSLDILNSVRHATSEFEKELWDSTTRAILLAGRYIRSWASDYIPLHIEKTFKLNDIVVHPDLVAIDKHKRIVIVDYKTSKNPEPRWFEISGQADLYAHVVKYHGIDIDLISYEVISDEGIFRQQRPPRPANRTIRELYELKNIPYGFALWHPHFEYNCPSSCEFFEPCYLLETSNNTACLEYLKANYNKLEGGHR